MSKVLDTIKKVVINRQVDNEDAAVLVDFLLDPHIENGDGNLDKNILLTRSRKNIIFEAVQIFSELNKKIHAIKFLRTVTGCSLKDGKEWVDKYFAWSDKTPVNDD
jgi:hypothetical protein